MFIWWRCKVARSDLRKRFSSFLKMRKSRLSSVMRHWMKSREGLAVLTYIEAVFLNFYGTQKLIPRN
jgi:hypothetical protein